MATQDSNPRPQGDVRQYGLGSLRGLAEVVDCSRRLCHPYDDPVLAPSLAVQSQQVTRRVILWFEAIVGIALGGLALFLFGGSFLHASKSGGTSAMYAILATQSLIAATAFLVGARGSYKRGRLWWYGQMLPGAVVAWVLWDLVSYLVGG